MRKSMDEREVRFFSSDSPAHGARLLEYEGGLYRAIRPERAVLFERLLKEGAMEDLAAKGLLIRSDVSSLSLSGYSLVFKHPRIPFVTYPFEWPASALKDAGLRYAELNLELARHGVICHDSHPWNLVFDGANPIFVDLGSIVPLTEVNPSSPQKEFNGYFTYPLRLMARGRVRVARRLLTDLTAGMSEREAAALGDWRARYDFVEKLVLMQRRIRRSIYKRMGRKASPAEFQAVWRQAGRTLAGINVRSRPTLWSNYGKERGRLDAPTAAKEQAVCAILDRLKPKTVLDLGCNTGWYAQSAAHLGARVAACDIDETCLEMLYAEVKEKKLAVTTSYLDMRVPSASHGWDGTHFPSAMDRLRAECVLALALVHHLVFWQFADFELITNTLCRFASKHLVVEFISREDEFVAQWWKESYGWYTLENFLSLLGRRFERIATVPSSSKGRTLIVCEGFKGGLAAGTGPGTTA